MVCDPVGRQTIVLTDVIDGHAPSNAMIMSHTDETLEQARDKISQFAPHLLDHVGKVKAKDNDADAPIVLASVQTISRKKRLKQLLEARPEPFGVVAVDEAHHAAADTYKRVLEATGALGGNGSGPLLYGVTATADRGDGKGLDDVFEEIVTERSMLDMIEEGYLSDLRAVQVVLEGADYKSLRTRAGDFVASELEEMLDHANAPGQAVEAYLTHAPGRKALLFTPTVASAYAMVEAFVAGGIPTEAIDGTTPMDQRKAILERFSSGETMVLANCAVLTEGFDEPSVEAIIVARPTKSRPLYQQMIGRGTRLFPTKDDCVIVDLVGAATRHDLVTAASLFGVDKKAIGDGGLLRAVAYKKQQEAEEEREGVLVARTVDLFRRRSIHWIIVKPGEQFAISCGDRLIALTKFGQRQRWDAQVFINGTFIRNLASDTDLAFVQGVAEEYAKGRDAGPLNNPKARWRRKPASEKQIKALRAWGAEREIHPEMTAGEASDILSVVIGLRGGRRGA